MLSRMLIAAGMAAALAAGPAARADRPCGGYASVSYGGPAYMSVSYGRPSRPMYATTYTPVYAYTPPAYSYTPAYPGDSYYAPPVAYSYTPAYPGDSYYYAPPVALRPVAYYAAPVVYSARGPSAGYWQAYYPRTIVRRGYAPAPIRGRR